VNYSLPEDPAVYLHRAGRTGRIGKKGTALSLATGAEGITLGVLQKKFGIVFEEKQMPSPEEARRLWTDRHVAELREGMNSTIFEAFIPLAQELRNRPDGGHLLAFALKYFFTHHRIEKVQDVVKAVHKKEEHDRKEQRVAPKREARSESRPAGRERSGRDRGERAGPAERGDRGERRPRRDRPADEPRPAAKAPVEIIVSVEPQRLEAPETDETPGRPARARIFVSAGEVDGADEAKVRETVAGLAPGLEISKIEIRRTHTFLEVGPDDAERVVSSLTGKEGFGKTLAAEKARRRRR
jgi:ATP-dependent RNA helicase DeaD